MSSKKSMRKPHYATTKDARVIQSREALQHALLELLEQTPFKDIKIRDITGRAGIGYNTFFRHYGNKDELLKEIAAGEIKGLIELSLAALGEVNTSEAARAVCGYVADHSELWSALLAAGAVDTLREEFVRQSRLEAEKKQYTQSLPAEVGILLVASGTIELLAWWIQQSEPISVEELSSIYEELVVAPTIKIYSQ